MKFHIPNNLEQWMHSIVALFVGGASSALAVIIVDPNSFNFSHEGLIKTGKVAFVGGVIPVLAFLKQYPTPKEIVVQKQTSETVTIQEKQQ